MRFIKFIAASICLWSLAATSAIAAGKITKVEIYPKQISLTSVRDFQKLILVATCSDSVTLDVTMKTKFTIDSKLIRIENSVVYPIADGKTTIQVEVEGHKLTVPVTIDGAKKDPAVSFKTDIMPIFLRTGCNTGSCHGSSRGKDGFRLSIFGFDPDGDYHRLTREISARRLNLAVPKESLMLEKCDGTVVHTGGKRFDRKSDHYKTILRWLEAGALKDKGEVPKVVKVELFPPAAVLEGAKTTQQFSVRATYSNGTDRDVTNLAVFSTNNGTSAEISDQGLVTAGARGEAYIMARFDVHSVGSQVLVFPKNLKYTPPTEKPVNYIDELVGAKLRKVRLEPSALCSDDIFLRRVTLDITGTLPSPAEYKSFMVDKSPDKRKKLIDQLLARKEFGELWAMKWAQLLMIKSSNQVSYKSMYLYNNWLTNQISSDVPLNVMVEKLLSADGGTFKNPPTNFYQNERNTLKMSENVAQVFMGIRTQCAQCHNHPFDRWTMDDYYGFAAFFTQIGRKSAEDYRETIIFNSGSGEMRHIVGKKVVAPKFLGGVAPDTKGKDRRKLLAKWIVSNENPYFATSVANRIWANFFGIGIIEPVDDIRVSNPASNPELFDTLGKKLIEYKFDTKKLIRDICNSNTYQRATQRNASNEKDTTNFAYSRIRRIPAENLLDCISNVTKTQDKFRGLPLGARAVQIADGRTSTYFLNTFGRSPRKTVCACEATTDPTLSQALNLINGNVIQGKIRRGGLITTQIKAKVKPEIVLDNIYLHCLSRKPSEKELTVHMGIINNEKNKTLALEDIFWAVLNSREFIFNH